VLVLVLEWKRRSGLRRSHVGLVGIVTGSLSGATPYQTFEHEDEHEHDLVAACRAIGFAEAGLFPFSEHTQLLGNRLAGASA